MANDMAPKRGYDFKSKGDVDPVRLQTELDKIFSAFAALKAFLGVSLDGDGTLRGSTVEKRNLKDGVFRDQEQRILDAAQVFLDDNTQINRSVQNFLMQAMDQAKMASSLADDARSALGQTLQALDDVRKLQNLVNQGRARAEFASVTTDVRAQDAATSSSSARISEDMAYRWAEKMDGPVYVPEGGDPVDDGFFSSKWWASYAKTSVEFGSYWYLGPHPVPPTEGHGGVPLEQGMWYFDTTDNIGYIWDGTQWIPMTAGALVTSVFGRTGAITAQQSDYELFYSLLGHVHDWSEIQNKPSTFPPAAHTHPLSEVPSSINTTEPLWRVQNNWVGATFDDLPGKPSTYPPDPHTHVEADITDLNRVRWRNEWSDQQYFKNDMVRDGEYTMIANKDTTDRAGPVARGEETYLYDGADPTVSLSAKTLLCGNVYTYPEAMRATAYRVYAIAGNYYSVYLTNLQTGQTTQIANFLADSTGWVENGAAGNVFPAGTSFELAAFVQEPDPVPVIDTLSYNYVTPNSGQPSAPASGQIQHHNKGTGELRIHKTDQNGDQSAVLGAMTQGDTISGAGMRWAIDSISDQGTYFIFGVNPTQQGSPDGVQDFDFETVTTSPITVIADPDYYLPFTAVQPFYEVDGGGRVLTDDAYNVDIKLQAVDASEDWDLVSTMSSAGSPGSGGAGASVSIGPDFPLAPNDGDLHWKTVDHVGLYLWYTDENSSQWVQTNSGGGLIEDFVKKSGDTMTGNLFVNSDVYSEDFFAVQKDAKKNEAGIQFLDELGQAQAYWFWDKAGQRLRLNTYIDGVYQNTKMEVPTISGAEIEFNENVRVNNNTLVIDADAGVNSHLYFAQGGVNKALIYHPTGSNTGQLQFNQYDAAGNYLSSAFVEHANGISRFTAGDFYATADRYFGYGAGFSAVLANTNNANGTFFHDLHYLGYLAGTGGPTGVSLVGANAANTVAGYNFCDQWSDVSLKAAVQPASGSLASLQSVDIISFDWGGDILEAYGARSLPRVDAGFDAAQLETVFPDMVNEVEFNPQSDIADSKPSEMRKIVNSKLMIPHLVKAIQELTERLEALENDG